MWGFFLTISPYFLYPFLGSNLPHDCHPEPGKAALCSSADKHPCHGAQQSCVTGAGSSRAVGAQQEGRAGVTSLPFMRLLISPDRGWQRGPTAVRPPEPFGTRVRHPLSRARAALHPVGLKAG